MIDDEQSKQEMEMVMKIEGYRQTLSQMLEDAKKVLEGFNEVSLDSEYKKQIEDFIAVTETVLRNQDLTKIGSEITLNKLVLTGSSLLENYIL